MKVKKRVLPEILFEAVIGCVPANRAVCRSMCHNGSDYFGGFSAGEQKMGDVYVFCSSVCDSRYCGQNVD